MSDTPMGVRRVERLGEIEAQISELWRLSAREGRGVTRACKMNLVVLCPEEGVDGATQAVARITEQHPSRALVLACGGREAQGMLEALVSAHCHRAPDGTEVCSEQVTIRARGDALSLLPQAVLRLLVADTPVYVWWRGASLDDPLVPPILQVADRFIVNTYELADPLAGLATLATIAADSSWRGNAGDLAWVRTDRWRELMASLFDPPEARRQLDCIVRLVIAVGDPTGKGSATVAAAYLAGWAASRLGWTPAGSGGWVKPNGGPVAIELRRDGSLDTERIEAARFELRGPEGVGVLAVEREVPGGDCVRLRGAGPDVPRFGRLHKLTQLNEILLLHGELQRDARDPIFEAALREAARMLEPG